MDDTARAFLRCNHIFLKKSVNTRMIRVIRISLICFARAVGPIFTVKPFTQYPPDFFPVEGAGVGSVVGWKEDLSFSWRVFDMFI